MPRKINYGVDYEEDYDDYEAYDYYDDYDDYDHEVKQTAPQTKKTEQHIKAAVWSCPICTFDNDEFMSECEICGVLRNPLVKGSNKSNTDTVDSVCKDSGASIMARSLFASLQHQKPKKSVIFEAQKDAFMTGELGNIHGDFHDFHRAFIFQNNTKINIAPFKFDAPSPDDLVSHGMRASKLGSKVNSSQSSPSNVPSKERENSIEVEQEVTVEGPDCLSASTSRGQHIENVKRKDSSMDIDIKKESVSGDMMKMSISAKSGNAKGVNRGRVPSSSPYKPEKWMLPDRSEDRLTQLNLAIVGHVDAGKSTLSGRLLHLFGRISQKDLQKYEKEAKQQGKGSFAYAWALDESAEERERGITMTVAVAYFDSKKYHVVLLDSPGHRDFVPNMISGATQADAAILVIDASIGAFEAGIDASGGQTREHTQLIRSFGVDQIIVAVNKMDAVEYSAKRFNIIRQKLGMFLRSCGFKDSSIFWVPMSAMENQNLAIGPSDARFSWYQGPCLLDAIDALQPPSRDYSKPLLLPICDVVKSQSQGQVSICGKVETGAVRSGSKVLVMPSKEIATVRSLERDSRSCNIARAGDNVTVNLQGLEPNRVIAGGVLCHPDFPVKVSNKLELKIVVLEITTPILIGSQFEFHIHHAKEAARVAKLLALLDPKTGKETKKSPRCLLAKQNAIIEVVLQGDVCVEEYTNCRNLGRVSLRASGRTVALGVVTKIAHKEQ
ncbi:hypothetical protein M9H77_29006 [Catharanthus roseus]|uniref:Uncharacterized protein n=1 Tax=Catharanthus roseus TaxID=4058 RepID=A0ACC0AJP3_CATRO|nr:hypothetical protein M9H77_29006 [Catharanthus roseus]